MTIPQNAAFQTEDLDAYYSDCDDLSSAKAILMANLSSYDSDVLSEVPYSDAYPNDMLNQDVQEIPYSEQTHIVDSLDNEIHNDSNIIPRSQYLQETQDARSIEAPRELPKVSLVNESLKKLKYQLAKFDKVVKNRTTSDAITTDIMHIAMNSIDILDVNKTCVNECCNCFELETELLKKKDFIEKESQEKDTVIRKLKDRIKSLMDKEGVENVKKDIDEIETINIELEHSVAKLLSENKILRKEREHLKSIYKDQFDSIRKTRVQSKEYCDSLIAQINAKSLANLDLNAQLQEKINLEPLAPKILQNKDVHMDYIKHSRDNANILWELVKNARALSPIDSNLDLACYASGSQSSGNTKIDRISQPSCSTKTNKVEDQSRSVKSRKNKKNRVGKTECNAYVMQSMLNANSVSESISNALVKHSMKNAKSKSLCAIGNKCLFDANNDMRLIDCVNDMNLRSKAKSKKNKKRKV
ncbi:hypothetical protein Tco_1142366 [Tanacetum coccineum]